MRKGDENKGIFKGGAEPGASEKGKGPDREPEVLQARAVHGVARRELAENVPNLVHKGGNGIVIVASTLDLIQVPYCDAAAYLSVDPESHPHGYNHGTSARSVPPGLRPHYVCLKLPPKNGMVEIVLSGHEPTQNAV